MADSVQVEGPQRRAVGGTITTGRIHKGNDLDDKPYVIHYKLRLKTKTEVICLNT